MHPAEAAWRKVGADVAEIERVDVLEESKKTSVYRLVRPDRPPVIAKRYAGDGALFERAIYEEVLSPAGVSRLAFHGALPSQAGEGSWSFTEDAGGVQLSLDDAGHRREAASWLGDLHAASSPLVATQPRADQGRIHHARLTFAREALAEPPRGASSPRIDELADAARVLGSVSDAWPAIEGVLSAGPATLVHGDFGRRNVRVRSGRKGRRVVAYDWEMAVVGSPAVDLWWLAQRSDRDGLSVYQRAATALWRDVTVDELLGLARVGLALRLVDCIYWSHWDLEWQVSSVLRWSRELEGVIRLLQDGAPLFGSEGPR
ncbi:MAG TPA: aminoglycoside phosphotransferase family protein [Vicinamibacteria bacterium]